MTASFGQLLRQLRTERGFSLRRLASETYFDFGYIGQIERGERGGSAELAERCDRVLGTGDCLRMHFAQVHLSQPTTAHTDSPGNTSRLVDWAPILAANTELEGASLRRRDFILSTGLAAVSTVMTPPDSTGGRTVSVDGHPVAIAGPSGKLFSGSITPGMAFTVGSGDKVRIDLPTGFGSSRFLASPQRQLIIGSAPDGRLYGLSARQARRKISRCPTSTCLVMPAAYRLDDITHGLLWAVSNLDDALLDDDIALHECIQQVASRQTLQRPAAGHDHAGDLTAVSRAWLGSDFCARHILGNLTDLSEIPHFWTREQHGEEASTWLLFIHKYEYLQKVAAIYGTKGDVRRSFCIPPEAVKDSPTLERILLLLSVALMESFGIRVQICTDSQYTAIEGFVSDKQQAILANWVGSKDLWHVDVTRHRPTITEYNDALGHATNGSVIDAAHPHQRLRAAADYLQLDWNGLRQRCQGLSDYGLAGLLQPRSRLLSLQGAQRACDFVTQSPVT